MGRLALGERPGVQWGSTRRAFTSSLERQALSQEMMRSENSRSPHASEEAEKPASRCDRAQVRAMGKAGGGPHTPKSNWGRTVSQGRTPGDRVHLGQGVGPAREMMGSPRGTPLLAGRVYAFQAGVLRGHSLLS